MHEQILAAIVLSADRKDDHALSRPLVVQLVAEAAWRLARTDVGLTVTVPAGTDEVAATTVV